MVKQDLLQNKYLTMLSWSFEHGKKLRKHGQFWGSNFLSLKSKISKGPLEGKN